MKWLKVDRDGKPIAHNSGWHIPNYISGEYKITNNNGKYILTKNNIKIGEFKTLKEAKAKAEAN